MTIGVGCHRIPREDYVRDPCAQPSLSSSLARLIVGASPLHAWTASPRLNPDHVDAERDDFDLGTVVHAYLLEGDVTHLEVVNAPDWRKKEAQAIRDEARAAGRTPLLAGQWERVQAMAAAAKRQVDAYEGTPRPLADGGTPEETFIWEEQGVWCRARLDWLHGDARTIDDLKSVGGSAHPDAWARTMWGSGLDMQAAFYIRGVRAVLGVDAEFRFVLIETHPPYALSVVGLTPAALELADRKVRLALNLWRECLERNVWPGFPTSTCYIDAPPWELAKDEARAYAATPREPIDDGRPLAEQLWGDRS